MTSRPPSRSAGVIALLAGLALLAQASSGRPGYRWLVVALVGAMLGIPFFPSEAVCRAVWGLSALVLFGVFILVVRWAMTRPAAG